MVLLPKLAYPLTRSFTWSWFTPLALFVAASVLSVFTVINVVLAGYETVTIFDSNFNATQHHWYDGWLPVQGSKDPCDPQIFNPGDSFTTNYSIFQWTFQARSNESSVDTGIAYRATTLDTCDISAIVMGADLRTTALNVRTVMSCANNSNFDVTADTRFSYDRLSFVGANAVRHPNNTIPGFLDILIQAGIQDANARIQDHNNATSNRSPTSLSLRFDVTPCPYSAGRKAECATTVPVIDITNSALAYSNGTMRIQRNISDVTLPDELVPPFWNIAQTIIAMVRIDLGNPSPNNFFVNHSALRDTLFAEFEATLVVPATGSLLYEVLDRPEEIGAQDLLPVHVDGPAVLRIVYACRVQQRKSLGPAVISVIVATLSMFTAGWAAFMFLATVIAKWRDNRANQCEVHTGLPSSTSPPASTSEGKEHV